MAIVDNRTSITNAESGGFVDASGSSNGSTNNDFFIEGSGSHGVQVSAGTDALLYDFGTAQDFSNNHFYIWWLLTTAGLADTLAGGGVRIRFAGSTIGNFFEVYIAGSDTYSGGFVMSVIDIESAATSPDNTGGTPPGTNSIQYVGIFFDVPGMVPGNVPNCFVDAMWRLPANTPGMLVEGQNGGADWTWGDIVNAADAGDTTKAWGTAFRRDGVIFINTPIRFGANDATTHGFSDTSEVIAWEDQTVASTFYDLEIIGGTGTQSFSIGTRVGTGDDSIGHSGCVFLASTTGQRYTVTASDANIDTCEFLGCTFSHSSTIDMSNVNSEVRSSLITDGSFATHADAGGDGIFQKNTVVNANTADGVAYLTTDNPAEIKNTSFVFSDGHAIEITQTGTYTFTGNTFSGYGADDTNDAAIYNNSGGLVTLNITGGGDSPTVRNGSGASTTINNNINLTVNIKDQAGNNIPGVEVAVFQDDASRTVVLSSTPTDENGQVTTSVAASLGDVIIRARQSAKTTTFDTNTGVDGGTEVITTDANHNFQDGDAVVYSKDGGSESVGLTEGNTYYVNNISATTLSLHTTAANAISDTSRVNLTAGASSETHQLDPVRYVPASATGSVGTTDFSAQVTMVTDTIATG